MCSMIFERVVVLKITACEDISYFMDKTSYYEATKVLNM